MKNSWLSFTLPEEIRDILYNISQKIETKTNFSKMSYSDLHMTSIFMGKSFKNKDFDKLLGIVSEVGLEGEFVFDRLDFFPPGKQNLIVAIFKSTSNVEEKIRIIKQRVKTELKCAISEEEINSEFVPHLTLGKLNLTKIELETLIKSDFLKDMNKDLANRHITFEIDRICPCYPCGSK